MTREASAPDAAYREAVQFLFSLRAFGSKLGLETTLELARRAGNPQAGLRFIHVAGTNGKGSTCAFLESIYRQSLGRVGLYTSPHLISFGERIQVNRRPAAADDIVRLLNQIRPLLDGLPTAATFFEITTVLAFLYFAEQQCDLVILETGMGGRLDATNIVQPLASLITNIQLDHQNWLGHTRAQIAAEKAGVIKPLVPVLTTESNPALLKVIANAAREKGAPLHKISSDPARHPFLDSVSLPLLGDHQRLNAALAAQTARLLHDVIPVHDDAIRAGLTATEWPGRFQLLQPRPGQNFILDAAHNPACALILRAAVQKYYPHSQPTVVLGMLSDKDWPQFCKTIAPLAGRICLVPLPTERSADPRQLALLCQRINPYVETRAFSSVPDALRAATPDPLVLITGSLYLVGEALAFLQPDLDRFHEQELNEYHPAR